MAVPGLLAAGAVSVASAANGLDTWDGAGNPNFNWSGSSPANWTGANTTPVAGDTLAFAGAAGLSNTNNLPAGTQINGIFFNSGASAFNLYGNAITLAGGITNNSGSLQTILFPITNNVNNTLSDGGSGIIITNVIAGTGALTNAGNGTVTLASVNTFSGGVTINSGTLQVSGSGGKTGLGYGSAATVNSGGTLVGTVGDAFGYTANDSPGTILINGGTVTDLGTANYTITLANVTFIGGTLTSAPGNIGSGGFNFAAFGNGTLCTIATLPAATTAIINAAGLGIERPITFNVAAGNVTGGSTPGVDLLVSSTIAKDGSHAGVLTKTGAGTLEFSGANTFAVGMAINGGVLNVGAAQSSGSGPLGSSSDVISFGGGTLQYSPANAFDYSPRFNTAASQAYSIDTAGQNVVFANALTSSGGTLTLTNSTGSGTLTLAGLNTYNGATKINCGTLLVNGSLAAGSAVSIGAGALGGSGTVNGPVTTTSSNAQINQEIYDLVNGPTATFTLGSSLNMSAGGACYLDVNTSHLSGNDEIAVTGALTLSGNQFHINALSGNAPLDATGDYVLVEAGSLSGTPNGTPVWDGTPPSNSADYIITTSGANVVLRNTNQPGPVITSAIAAPSPGNRLQSVSFSVTVSNGVPPYSVTVDTSSMGGSVLSLMTNGSIHIFTNTVSLANVADGVYSLLATATDNNSQSATAYIALTVTGVALTWNGDASGNNIWGTGGELEWMNGLTYQDGDFARFDDSATGLAATNVNVAAVAPGSITVSNTAASPMGLYTFSGASGQISGSGALIKQGTGTLLMQDGNGDVFTGGIGVSNGTVILDNPGAASGGLTIASGGTVEIGTNDTAGYLPSGPVVDNGSLVFDRSDFVTVSTAITGAGGLSEIGNGTLMLSGASTFTGNVVISNGTVALPNRVAADGSSSGLGSFTVPGRTVSVGPGGTLSGTINNWFGSSGSVLDSNFPAMTVNGGTVTSTRYTALGNVTLNSGATLTQASTDPSTYQGYQFRGNVTVGGASTSIISNSVTGAADDLGSNTVFNVAVTSGSGPDLTVSTGLRNQSGDYGNAAGGFTKAGAGTMLLDADCTYTGNTVVSNGVLALDDSGSISNTPNIVLGSGAQINVSARTDDTLTLNSGQTLSGSGTVLGNVTTAAGATIAPGTSAAIGSLTVTNVVSLSGTVTMKLNAAAGTNDLLTGAQAIVYGGTLNLTNTAGTLAGNQTFKLFSAASYSGAFTATNLPAPGPGLVWITTNLGVNGTISVAASVNTNATNITFAVIGGNSLVMSWPADHTGWGLQVQTNTLAAGLNPNSNAWYSVPGSSTVNGVTNPIVTTNGAVFYRMIYPPLVP
jgi:autotransporter-associated beta strand protein